MSPKVKTSVITCSLSTVCMHGYGQMEDNQPVTLCDCVVDVVTKRTYWNLLPATGNGWTVDRLPTGILVATRCCCVNTPGMFVYTDKNNTC